MILSLLFLASNLIILLQTYLMKKIINTLPSTKPDIFYESQPTFASNYEIQPKCYQQQIQNLINQIKKVHKYRCHLLLRDFEQIFKSNINIFVDLLSVSSSNQLLNIINGDHVEQVNQKMQLNLLLTLLLQMNKCKYRYADLGNIKKFDQLRSVIQWFIPQIVLFEAHLRQKIQEKILASCQAQKMRRQGEFAKYEQSTKRQFEKMQQIRINNLNRRLNQQRQYKDYEIKQKIQSNIYKIRASSELKEAKDKTLLRKLAPYRWEKKRIYQDSTYQQNIENILENDEQRRLKLIENMKKVQKEKLRRAHDNLISTQEMRADTERDKMLNSLNNEKNELKNNEQKNLKNLKHSIDIANNIKVSHLKKSLEAFTRHEDTLKIKQIMANHHYKLQFCNDIQQITKPQTQIQKINSRYLTINTQRQSNNLAKTLHRHQNRLQKQLKLVTGEQQQELRMSMNGGRKKSLVDLYDKSLNLVI